MKIKHATLCVWDFDAFRLGKDVVTLDVKGADAEIQWNERADLRYGEIRRYVTDAAWAADLGNQGDDVLTDWFQVWSPNSQWLGGRLVITGTMRSTKGIARNAASPRTGRRHPDPFTEERGEPLVMVEWTLW